MGRGLCFFRVKALNAQRAGAPAVVVVEDVLTRRGIPSGTLAAPGIRIPVVFASARAVRDGAEVRVNVDAVSERRLTHNVIAETPGGNGARVVMAGGHLDSVAGGPGINDNGSGVATLIETAEAIGPDPPGARVRLAFWGAEELGLLGSRRYVSSLAPRRAEADQRLPEPRHGRLAERRSGAVLRRRRRASLVCCAARGRPVARRRRRGRLVGPRPVRGGGRAGERPLHGLDRARPRRPPARPLLPPRVRHHRQREPSGAAANGARGGGGAARACPLRRSRRPARAPRTATAAARPRTSSTRRPA